MVELLYKVTRFHEFMKYFTEGCAPHSAQSASWYTNSMKLGVFDSGIGGEAIARELERAFPDADITTVNDRAHVPYGDKLPDEVRVLTEAAIQPILGSDVIVIACNTATTLALPYLRKTHPQQTFIGIEPMLKPAAAHTQTGVICVCATPATLASERYRELKANFTANHTIIEPDCSQWAAMIEHNTINEQVVGGAIYPALERGADVIVLGCTHYHWIKELVQNIAGSHVTVLEPSEAIARRIQSLLDKSSTAATN